MPLHIRDIETDALVRELARRKGVGLAEAVKLAVQGELRRDERPIPLRDRLRAIAAPLSEVPDAGPLPNKAFFDSLSGH
ncbi:MAG TPA: type II toxin-antitoxin system VapB family antitoxin [Xanthobacteraceae bacterium]|nr:type II toxin-antitoxin system VapB family antitoxin [Xanthobacteraceae bacterium]